MTDTPVSAFPAVCPQPQCQALDAKTLHSGYVTHRNKGEEACAASTTGHNRYMKDKRIAKQRQFAIDASQAQS